jgi:hypothetical protein
MSVVEPRRHADDTRAGGSHAVGGVLSKLGIRRGLSVRRDRRSALTNKAMEQVVRWLSCSYFSFSSCLGTSDPVPKRAGRVVRAAAGGFRGKEVYEMGKSKRKPRRLGRRVSLLATLVGVAASGFLAGFLPTATPTGRDSATSGGPAGCVVFQVSR